MYTSLVIEGGGAKNTASLGALRYLEEQKVLENITKFAGTSSGGIICTLLVMGFTPQEILDTIFSIDFNKLNSPFWYYPYNLLQKYGLNNSHKFIKFFQKLFTQKGFDKNVTFAQLYQKTHKTLVLTGANISKQKCVYFHYLSYPNLPVIKALSITMNIPVYFTSIKFEGDYFVDGFLLMNFPLYYFDEPNGHLCTDSVEVSHRFPNTTPSNKTVGIITLDHNEIINKNKFSTNRKINSVRSYIEATMNTMIEHVQHSYLYKNLDFWKQCIMIKLPYPIDITKFQLPKQTQIDFWNIGYETAKTLEIN